MQTRPAVVAIGLLALLVLASGHERVDAEAALDEVRGRADLRINHVQITGTHNSYHTRTGPTAKFWLHYEHAPLREQVSEQGVRQLELDAHWDEAAGIFRIFHHEGDEGSHCPTLGACVGELRAWSVEHPGHHPLFVFIQLKQLPDELPLSVYDALDGALADAWPTERTLTPDRLRGDATSLKAAVASWGWPSLDAAAGHAVFVLLETDGRGHRERYARGGTSLRGRAMFVTAVPTDPYGVVLNFDDPVWNHDAIRAAVASGAIVRTRSDAGTLERRIGSRLRHRMALSSGAQILSTDYPTPPETAGEFWAELPGGPPARCNPITAPRICTEDAVAEGPSRGAFAALTLTPTPGPVAD